MCVVRSNYTRTQLDEKKKKKKKMKVENYSFTVRKIIKRKMDNKQDGRILNLHSNMLIENIRVEHSFDIRDDP